GHDGVMTRWSSPQSFGAPGGCHGAAGTASRDCQIANLGMWGLPDVRRRTSRSSPARIMPVRSPARLRNGEHSMRKAAVFQLPAMPAAGPSYRAGPYRFIDREFLVISYETDPALIRAQLPEPLEPIEQPLVHYEWIKMPDSSGFGSYTESGMVIPARL